MMGKEVNINRSIQLIQLKSIILITKPSESRLTLKILPKSPLNGENMVISNKDLTNFKLQF